MNNMVPKRKFIGFIAAFMAVSLSDFAFAASKEEKKAEGAMSNPLTVEIPGVVVPIVNGKRLVNYVFMTIVVTASDDRSANLIRSNMFLIQDAIVRATSRNPIPVRNPANYFDKKAFGKQILPVVNGAILNIKVTNVDVNDPQFMKR